MILYCIYCKQPKKVSPYRKNTFKYCSRKCKHLAMTGQTPWNKDLRYDKDMKNKLNMRGLELGQGYFKGQIRNKTYPNIHYWIRKHKAYPKKCNDCGKDNLRLEWSNIDHRYRLVLDDYVARCKKCHTKYDYENHLSNKGSRGGSILHKRGGD